MRASAGIKVRSGIKLRSGGFETLENVSCRGKDLLTAGENIDVTDPHHVLHQNQIHFYDLIPV